MSVPQHGDFCTTRTFPAKCRFCGDEVFFFSCSCGSRVFFDELGPPWPEHRCDFSRSDRHWANSRSRTKYADGSVRVEISDGITAVRPAACDDRSWSIAQHVVATAKRDARSRESNPIQSVPPGSEWTKQIIGVVRELNPQVNVYQHLKIPKTAISEALLGDMGSGEWGRCTIHVLESVVYSYTIWVPASVLTEAGIERGVTVSAELERFDVPQKAREWLCRNFHAE